MPSAGFGQVAVVPCAGSALGQGVEQGVQGRKRLGDRLGDVLHLQQHGSIKSVSCNPGEDGRYQRAVTSAHTCRVEGDFSPPTSLCLHYRRNYL